MIEDDLIHLLHAPGLDKSRSFAAEVLSRYFRVEIQGLGHIPKAGPVILVPNHSGFAGFDAVVLSHEIHKHTGRCPKILAHRAYFDLVHLVAKISESFGLTRARMADAMVELKQGEAIMVFPEAEKGNFKSSLKKYQLQPFHYGAVRLALASGAPLIPTLIVGAEESNLNLGNIDLSGIIKHLVIPMPVNLLPLPSKWRIEFLPAFDVKAAAARIRRGETKSKGRGKKVGGSALDDGALAVRVTEQLRKHMQLALREKIAERKYIFVEGVF